MVSLEELDQFVKVYGRDGICFLILFCLIKTKAKSALHQHSELSEEILNRACMAKAKELLRLVKHKPTEKDIEEVLSHIGQKS